MTPNPFTIKKPRYGYANKHSSQNIRQEVETKIDPRQAD
jgi:hypothetical protein